MFLLIQRVFLVRVFHFAKIDHAIFSVNDQVNLRSVLMLSALPGKLVRFHAANSQRSLDLSDMIQAYDLKGIPPPGIVSRRIQVLIPRI